MPGTDHRRGPLSAREATVVGDGVVVRDAEPAVIDVLFDDRWVWSFHSARDTQPVGGRRRAPWPDSLRQFLHGTSRLTVRARFSGETLFDDEFAFDDSDGRVRIIDHRGKPLIVDKAGDLQCGFAERGQATVDALLDAIEDVLARLTDAGVAAFLPFARL